MSSSQQMKLVQMANQIADNLKHDGIDEKEAADKVANHIRRFWAGSMKAQLLEYASGENGELNRVARLAVSRLASS